MLTPHEFAALLKRYAAGRSTAAELVRLNQWLTQATQPSAPELTAAELAQVRAAIWRRIEEATK